MALSKKKVARGNAGLGTEISAVHRTIDALWNYEDALFTARRAGDDAQAALDEFKASAN